MSNYTKIQNYTALRGSTPADPAVFDTEFTAVQTAVATKADLLSPTFTGTPVLPTGTTGVTQTALTNNTTLATTAYTDAAVAVETSARTAADALLAPLASPTFTGTPTLPTGTIGVTQATANATTALATTAFATNQDLGVGQTWQAVTRNSGTTYNNGTGKPIVIFFEVSYSGVGAGLGQTRTLTVNGVTAAVARSVSGYTSAQSATAIIPPGANYVLTLAGTGAIAGTTTELR